MIINTGFISRAAVYLDPLQILGRQFMEQLDVQCEWLFASGDEGKLAHLDQLLEDFDIYGGGGSGFGEVSR